MNPTIAQILVPVDFSPHSDYALSYAAGLAASLRASVRLVHVLEPIPPMAVGEGLYLVDIEAMEAGVTADAELRMSERRARVAALGVAVTSDVLTGHPAPVIVNVARRWRSDLIVMGTHGRTGLAHMFIGGIAETVTRLAPCPVLTVRDTEWRRETAASGKAVATA
jgi:universal stress protein A